MSILTDFSFECALLSSVGADDVEQRLLVIVPKPLVQLTSKRRSMNESKASERVNVGKIVINHDANAILGRKLWRDKPATASEQSDLLGVGTCFDLPGKGRQMHII